MERRRLSKEGIDKVREIEGFPIGTDDDIIALSDPPYYTACPNPFIEEFIKEYGKTYDETTDDYHREPFAADVSEGKNDPIYNAHSYHTKVPHKAIMRYILHYTKPGDVVFDGFCGTGMTGVAAQMCGNPDMEFRTKIDEEMPYIKWGSRKAILSDLSPAATFFSYNYNTPIDIFGFEVEANKILSECEKECSWMYDTRHTIDGKVQLGIDRKPIMGRINYTVWSDVLICSSCSSEIIYWNATINNEMGKVGDKFHCANCGRELTKRECSRAKESHYDIKLNKVIIMSKQVPVLINYSIGKKRYEKEPDEFDLALIDRINHLEIPYWYPINELPRGYNTEQPKQSHGITHVHHFYTKRNLYIYSLFFHLCKSSLTKFLITSTMINTSKLYAYRTNGKGGDVAGTLYIPALCQENSIFIGYGSKLKKIARNFHRIKERNLVLTNSMTNVETIPTNSIDYVFTDPPFGSNLNYSELSFLWEAWIKVITNQESEAIMNTVQGKGLLEYQALMTKCFIEYYRVMKPSRWMTVEFHNSQNSVWNAIQEALQRSGFVIADIRTLDKQQGSFKQLTTTSAVKQDLVISAYKPKDSFKQDFEAKAGSEEAVWAFVRQHLEKLPIVVMKKNTIELVSERQAFLLFDRMVAYHIMNGIAIPIDATDFYKGLEERFLKRDNMYFLPDQVNEYDLARSTCEIESISFLLFVSDEKSAIGWLYQELDEQSGNGPQTYQDLSPRFMQECKAIDKREKMPELTVILEENFLKDELGKWYIPDLTKSGDIAKLREKNLLKEFQEYLSTNGKLKVFRSEAIRAGFAKLWKDKNYATIVSVAERLPDATIQEDPSLLMYYDISLSRVE